jgi:hypothetical protein
MSEPQDAARWSEWIAARGVATAVHHFLPSSMLGRKRETSSLMGRRSARACFTAE